MLFTTVLQVQPEVNKKYGGPRIKQPCFLAVEHVVAWPSLACYIIAILGFMARPSRRPYSIWPGTSPSIYLLNYMAWHPRHPNTFIFYMAWPLGHPYTIINYRPGFLAIHIRLFSIWPGLPATHIPLCPCSALKKVKA